MRKKLLKVGLVPLTVLTFSFSSLVEAEQVHAEEPGQVKVEQVNEGQFKIVLNDEATGEIENNQGVITDEATGETEVLPAQTETEHGETAEIEYMVSEKGNIIGNVVTPEPEVQTLSVSKCVLGTGGAALGGAGSGVAAGAGYGAITATPVGVGAGSAIGGAVGGVSGGMGGAAASCFD